MPFAGGDVLGVVLGTREGVSGAQKAAFWEACVLLRSVVDLLVSALLTE